MKQPHDTIRIPESFVSEHMHQRELAERLGMTEQEFFEHYLAGAIPQGVPMLAVIGQPWLVWPRADIAAWEAAGRPVDEDLADRTKRVITALRASIEAEYGATLETLVDTISTRN